jgi:hypothetical protein
MMKERRLLIDDVVESEFLDFFFRFKLSEVLVEWPEDFCDKSGRFQEKTDNQKS